MTTNRPPLRRPLTRQRWHARALALAATLGCCVGAAAQSPSAGNDSALPATTLAEGQRSDDRRPAQPTTITLGGQQVQLTGSWEAGAERRRNFDLNAARDRNRLVHDHELELEARWRPNARTEAFVQAVGKVDSRRTRGTPGVDRSRRLERGQTWMKFARLGDTPWSLQVGRLALLERRAWWWDEDLDAVRLQGPFGPNGPNGSNGPWTLDTGLAQQVARLSAADKGIDVAQRGVQRWFGQARWPYAQRQAIELFWLLQRDRSGTPAPGRLAANEDAADAADLNARWLGARISGEHRDSAGWRLSWRADAALLRGSERLTAWSEQPDGRLAAGATTRRRVRGQALDVGALLRLPLPATPTLSLGWARGSGGERSAVLDANFRQTGLQENKSRLGGVKRWRSYGELLRPELSNLAVTSLGLGLRLLDNSSLELVHHGYRQPVPSTVLSSTRLSSAPLGLGSDIGQEIDLLLALREWSQWELTLALAQFRPGAAFAANRRDAAYSLEIGVALNF